MAIAHADDLLLFIGGTIAALVKAGWQIGVVRATDDRWDSYQLTEMATIKANQVEFDNAMAKIGVSKVFELGLSTDLLADYSEVELRKQFIRSIREFKPYLILTFDPDSYLYEDNEDHKRWQLPWLRRAGRLALISTQTLEWINYRLTYQLPSGTSAGRWPHLPITLMLLSI